MIAIGYNGAMNNTPVNPHKQLARNRKVLLLVEIIDTMALAYGLQRDRLPVMLSDAGDEFWERAALLARVNPPSAKTIEQTIETYRKRAYRLDVAGLAGDVFAGLS